MPSLQYFQITDDQDAIFAALKQDGACIVHDLLSGEFCDHIRQDFQVHLRNLEWGENELGLNDEFYGAQTKRLHGLFSKSPLMSQVLTTPLLLEMAKHFLLANRHARDFRLSNAELMALNQHQVNQDFHSDGQSWHWIQDQENGEEILVSANIALTDFTDTNGSTRVVPGSHRWPFEADGNIRQPKASEICLATMPKGAALLYSGNVIHSGGENTTTETRIGLYLGYLVSWLRPIENQLATNNPEDILALPEQVQRMLDVVPGGFTVIA